MQPSDLRLRREAPRLASVDFGNEKFFMSDRAEQNTLSLLDYWRVIKRYKWSILGIALIAGIIGTISAAATTSINKAQARLWVKLNLPTYSTAQQFEAAPTYWLFFQTQSDIIKSSAVAERVVNRLNVERAGGADTSEAESAEIGSGSAITARVRELLDSAKSWLPEEFRTSQPAPLEEGERHAALVRRALSGLSVSGGTESEVLIVSYVSQDPRTAAEMANAFAEAYIEFGRESRSTSVQQATSWLGHRIEELRRKVVESEEALQAFQASEGLVDSEKREQIISAKLGTLTAELIKAQSRRGEAETRYVQIKSAADRGSGYEAISGIADTITVLEAHREAVIQEKRVAELSERYGHKHPKMIAARVDLEEATRRLRTEVKKAVDAARREFELAATQERQFGRMIDEQQLEMREISGKAFQLKQLEQDVQANRTLYETYLARFKESDVADEYDVSNARIIDRAIIPSTPFKPDRKQMVLVAVIIGLGIGVLVSFLREHTNNTFRTKEEVEEKLNLPVIGVLPRFRVSPAKKIQIERYVLADPHSAFSEAINDIRTSILFSHIDTPSKVVLVTSAIPGEGKTTLAYNLALAFSRRGRTLLIDADLRRGRLREIVGQRDHPGFTDMLSGACSSKEAIVADVDAENLFLLVAGTVPPNPLEIVSSKRCNDELLKLRNSFDYVIFDGAPLLPVSDALVLARMVDSIILTIKSDDTTCEIAREALGRLHSARVEPVGVVMQQVDIRKMRSYARRYATTYKGYYAYQAQTGV